MVIEFWTWIGTWIWDLGLGLGIDDFKNIFLSGLQTEQSLYNDGHRIGGVRQSNSTLASLLSPARSVTDTFPSNQGEMGESIFIPISKSFPLHEYSLLLHFSVLVHVWDFLKLP